MPRPHLAPRNWIRLDKHRKAKNLREWNLYGVQATLGKDAQYSPEITDDEQERLELLCIDEGTVYLDNPEIKKFYLKADRIIGACSGELTDYVFAEWKRSGGLVHGRPISVRRLQKMNISIA